MNTAEFLRKIWPDKGYYFIAIARNKGGFQHICCESVEHAEAEALKFSAAGRDTYFACASFREPEIRVPDPKDPSKQVPRQRVQKNVQWVRSFWLDLDVGVPEDGKPAKYKSQQEALLALVAWLKDLKLPTPMVVNSGYGIHVYWPLTDWVGQDRWFTVATWLKRIAANTGLLTDPARTSDSASVLRPIGTNNYKYDDCKPVSLVVDAEPIEYSKLFDLVAHQAKRLGVDQIASHANDRVRKLNEQFVLTRSGPPSDASRAADRCAQLHAARSKPESITEPVWYAALQVLQHTIGGAETCHTWAARHPAYSGPEYVDQKLRQLAAYGPATCETFASRNPEGCKGCPFAGKITSPIQLGVVLESAPAPIVPESPDTPEVTVTLPTLPHPFLRGGEDAPGIYVSIDDIPVKIYDYDLFPTLAVYDEHVGSEQTRARHWLPMEGWQEFTFESSALGDARAFNKAMREHHVQPYTDQKTADLLRAYMDAYLRKLKEHARIQRLFTSFGWKADHTVFVLGGHAYMADGASLPAGTSVKIGTDLTDKFGVKGDQATWTALTAMLAQPGLEPHAFAFCSGFAGPVMALTGYKGAVISMRGQTNGGKSTIAAFASSIWGTEDCNWISARATEFAIYGRLAALNNIPVYIDEVTNLEPEMVSQLVYNVANGATRERLKSNATPHEKQTWSTIMLVSLNDSIYDMLERHKKNSDPEKARVLEFELPVNPAFGPIATTIKRTIREHCGHAGKAMAQYLVSHWREVQQQVERTVDLLGKAARIEGMERFMVAAAASTLVGGSIAYKLGLIAFDPIPFLSQWVVNTISGGRETIKQETSSSVDVLAAYLDQTVSFRLVTDQFGRDTRIIKPPQYSITQRVDVTAKRMWVARNPLKEFCGKWRVNFDDMINELQRMGIISEPNVKFPLGKGVEAYAGMRVNCIEIDLSQPEVQRFLSAEE